MLTEEQHALYEENGYVLAPGLLTPGEAAMYRDECHALADRLSALGTFDGTWGSAKNVAGGVATQLRHCHDVQFYSAALTRLLVDERITGAAVSLIGPNVQLHHTKMFIKPRRRAAPSPCTRTCPTFPTTTTR